MLYSDPVTQGDDDSTVWRKLCLAKQQGGGAAPGNLSAPVLSDDTPDEGTNVSVSNGTWSGSPTSFTYQWYLNGVLQGETSNTFTLPIPSGRKEIYAIVTAQNSSGSTPAQSNIGFVSDAIDHIAGLIQRFESRYAVEWKNPDGDPVSAWEEIDEIINIAGPGNTGQAIPELRPIWAENTINGYGSGSYDGVDDRLVAFQTEPTAYSLFVLIRFNSSSHRGFGFEVTRSVDGYAGGGVDFGAFACDGVGRVDIGGPIADWSLVGITCLNGSTLITEVNGSEDNTHFWDTPSQGLPLTFGDFSGGGDPGFVDIAGCWLWNRALTSGERIIVRDYVSIIYDVP